MAIKRKSGPKPFKKADKRIPRIVTLSPKEYANLDRARDGVPFSTWARGVLLSRLKK